MNPNNLKPEAAPPFGKTRRMAWISLALGAVAVMVYAAKFQAYSEQQVWMLNLASGWLGLAAVFLGIRALQRARQAPSQAGRALAGLGIFLGLLPVLLFLVLLNPKAHGTAERNACLNNLRQLDGAKEQWALEFKKTASDRPTWNDLTGTDKYIKSKLGCPAKGVYTINDVGHKPLCSITDHTLM